MLLLCLENVVVIFQATVSHYQKYSGKNSCFKLTKCNMKMVHGGNYMVISLVLCDFFA